MKQIEVPNENFAPKQKFSIAVFAAVAFLLYYFSNPKPQHYYDYTFRVAANILRGGAVGFTEKPPSWLNEFVPFAGNWYSVFPLGGVLTMIPFAFFKWIGIVREMPGAFIAALSASAISIFLYLIASRYKLEEKKRVLLVASVLFGTWMWTNLTFAGAWQLALGFAMIGELGAIYFTVYHRKPLLAGVFFALAFGNRTENLLTAPIFMFLLARHAETSDFAAKSAQTENLNEKRDIESRLEKQKTSDRDGGNGTQKIKTELAPFAADARNKFRHHARFLAAFCVVPFFLGIATLFYNHARFGSFVDFGYARIPGVLKEPWYQHGIFSIWYIRGQAYEMLFRLWEAKADFPYYVPNGFSSSVLLTSPFLFLAARGGARDKALKYAAWTAIFLLTFLLWIHGNSGGWQFGYRYAMILLPWIFLILLETSPRKIIVSEWFLCSFSIAANAYATYLFHWTEYVKP